MKYNLFQFLFILVYKILFTVSFIIFVGNYTYAIYHYRLIMYILVFFMLFLIIMFYMWTNNTEVRRLNVIWYSMWIDENQIWLNKTINNILIYLILLFVIINNPYIFIMLAPIYKLLGVNFMLDYKARVLATVTILNLFYFTVTLIKEIVKFLKEYFGIE